MNNKTFGKTIELFFVDGTSDGVVNIAQMKLEMKKSMLENLKMFIKGLNNIYANMIKVKSLIIGAKLLHL